MYEVIESRQSLITAAFRKLPQRYGMQEMLENELCHRVSISSLLDLLGNQMIVTRN